MRALQIIAESWPIRGSFTISRGAKREAQVVVAAIHDGPHGGRGECVPYARYSESVAGVMAQMEALRPQIEAGLSREQLQEICPAGAARNALDCALWDLQAKQTGQPVWRLAGLVQPAPCITAFTLSLDSPDAMADAAKRASHYPLLKIKLGTEDIIGRVGAVHRAAPHAKLILDANEAWDLPVLQTLCPHLTALNVVLIEQPLPAGADQALSGFKSPIPLCADESCHGIEGLGALRGRYDLVNIKLDKTGGLTAALALAKAAREQGFGIMIGCMVGTSLAMAPAALLAGLAEFVDLDGPLLLEKDRSDGIIYAPAGAMAPPDPSLWG
ncbi:unnamed protein product [Phaeothamnion confervicola]